MTSGIEQVSGLCVADHVRFRTVGDQLIVLDLISGRYSGLDATRLPRFLLARQRVSDDPMTLASPAAADEARQLEPLIARGWIVRTATPSPGPVELPEVTSSLDADFDAPAAATGPARVLHCLRSTLQASFDMRHRSLLHSVRRITTHQGQIPHDLPAPHPDRLVEAVAAYLKLRPFFFTARHRCLQDSMTLVSFLADQRIAAHWVIGVRTRPFAAHSWVQSGEVVLNDQHERVRAFRPILVV